MADNNFNETLNKITNTADNTADYDSKDIEDNKIFSLLSYIAFLFIVPLLIAPKSKFARFHANQGLVLFIVDLILGIAVSIVSAIFGAIHLCVAGSIVGAVVGIAGLIWMVLGIVNAVTGRAKELPVIGGIKIIK